MKPASARYLGRFVGDGNQCRFGHSRAEAPTEGEGQQYEHTAPTREALSDGVTEREQARFPVLG